MRKILFVDRDGTILIEPEDKQIDSLAKVSFIDGALPALMELKKKGWELILVSNQDGLGTDSFPEKDFWGPQNLMLDVLKSCGVEFSKILICPHLPSDACRCRKPKTGLLTEVIREGFDYDQSAVIGDRDTDMELAEILGVAGLRIEDGKSWQKVLDFLVSKPRTAEISRRTKETRIEVRVNLDSNETPSISTGHPFFDHMLEQIAYHAQIFLAMRVEGDWKVDDHHSIEDTAIALGQALQKAIGGKFGLERYGFLLPMDESLAEIALDLSGRSFSRFEAPFTRDQINGLSTEMIPHFFQSLAESLKATLHIKISGSNNHHLVESAFKGFGRCLGQAIRRTSTSLPSSKGAL